MADRSNEIPVYIINGFLESGKSTFINDTITADYFRFDKLTIILACEEGEVEFDINTLKKHKTVVEYIGRDEINDKAALAKLISKHKAGRVIIEYNGMWAKDLPLEFPDNWLMHQQITVIDGSSFGMYFANNDLKSLFMNMIKASELIIFNRVKNDNRLKDYLRSIKAVNSSAAVMFENENGYPVSVRVDEDLPYDMEADSISLDESSYGIWFIDMMDRADAYEGKSIRFTAQVLKPPMTKGDMFAAGRRAMTCCADDIQFLGYVCRYKGANELNNKDWVEITARVSIEYFEGYRGEGPVLYATEVKKTQPPKDELIYFGNF